MLAATTDKKLMAGNNMVKNLELPVTVHPSPDFRPRDEERDTMHTREEKLNKIM